MRVRLIDFGRMVNRQDIICSGMIATLMFGLSSLTGTVRSWQSCEVIFDLGGVAVRLSLQLPAQVNQKRPVRKNGVLFWIRSVSLTPRPLAMPVKIDTPASPLKIPSGQKGGRGGRGVINFSLDVFLASGDQKKKSILKKTSSWTSPLFIWKVERTTPNLKARKAVSAFWPPFPLYARAFIPVVQRFFWRIPTEQALYYRNSDLYYGMASGTLPL